MSPSPWRTRFSPVFIALFLSLFRPFPAFAQGTTALFFQSQAGDYIGAGESHTYTPVDGNFTIGSYTNGVSGSVLGPPGSFWWYFDFAAPTGVPLTPGTYETARRYPFTSFNGLSFSGSGRGCNTLTGRFVVLEAVYGSGGTVLQFAADFEQHCEDGDAGLFGAIRYHSTISSLSPFGGNFPVIKLAVPTPVLHGTVSSSGSVICGTGGAVCSQTFATATSVAVTATPDPGYIFAGWTDDCRGGPATTVRVNGPKVCGARFELEASTDPRTLIVFDSQAGDSVGGGKPQVYSSANSRITATKGTNPAVLTFTVASVDATRESSWTITLAAAHFAALSVGTYEGALTYAGEQPELQVSFCSGSFGRFIIHELVLGADNTVTRAAVDLEQHCGNADAGFFAAIRYNSTVVNTVPFGGAYPVYRLTLTPPANGTISGGGLSCGSGGAACNLTPASPSSVGLTATPDPGFLFAGWTGGACIGGAALTIRVNSIKMCSAVFEPLVTATARSRAVFDYAADSRGVGTPAAREALSGLNTYWTVQVSPDLRVLTFQIASLDPYGFYSTRYISFLGWTGQALTPGAAYPAVQYATALPSMDLGFSCGSATGRFVVRDLVVSGSVVQRAAIDFEHHCNDADPALFGSIRYESALEALPFGGDYPRYQLTVSAPPHGRVSGAGLDCGAAGPACQIELPAPSVIGITAVPDAGYVFAGWTGACHGGETIAFRLNTVRRCNALFEPAAVARTFLRMASEPGDPVLQGRSEVFTEGNSVWASNTSGGTDWIWFQVYGFGDTSETRWSLEFRAPNGQKLAPGTYTNASSSFSSTQPYLLIYGSPFSCAVTGSRFTIRELVVDSKGVLTRAAVDFEQHCNTVSSPALTGTIEYAVPTLISRLAVDKTRLSFASMVMPDNTWGNTTAPQAVRLAQTAGANVPWTVSTSDAWLRVTPMSGTGPATLTVSVQPGLGGIGTSQGTVTVSTTDGSLSPINVTWTRLPGTTAPPFGLFETPLASTQNLSGAIALTGWALDDVEVTKVQIWRQAHRLDPPAVIYTGPGPANGKVFVGDATLVDGARPDVEAAFALPNRSRAGWGYMLLSRVLIWDGQGLFTVHAIATDREGHVSEIGSTMFSIDNAQAKKPFGTIDTPGQGAVASGVYPNTGWVLTSSAGANVPAGAVRVMVDGAFLSGVPTMSPRSDITSLFPAFDTSQAGRGLFIDTRGYADGTHTIAWIATDSTGQADGLGSRFFQIANGGTASLTSAVRSAARQVPGASNLVDAAPAQTAGLRVRRGFDATTPFETVEATAGTYELSTEELDRVEIRLPPVPGASYTGYLRARGELRPLPAGAALDGRTGTFTWQPAAGFIGPYDFVFVCGDPAGPVSRHEVRVTLTPRIR